MNYYDTNAESLFKHYQSASSEMVHAFWLDLLPAKPGCACDIGAGSGRDATWLATNDWKVIAVEPCEQLRNLGESFTTMAAGLDSKIKWLNDSLPHLNTLVSADQKFDLIILSAVWMHLRANEYRLAMNTLQSLLTKNGLLVISLRNGPDPEKRFFKTSLDELIQTARSSTLSLVRKSHNQVDATRSDISWDTAVFTNSVEVSINGDGF